jgi:adenylyl- and sulfurtransferase ThiI
MDMDKMDLMQLVMDQMSDLYSADSKLSPEERKLLQLDYERNIEKLTEYNKEARKERDERRLEAKLNQSDSTLDKQRQLSTPIQPESSLLKLTAELKEVKEQLINIQSEEIEDTSHFALPARVRRLEQLLATNVQDINTCWERLGELQREMGRLKSTYLKNLRD